MMMINNREGLESDSIDINCRLLKRKQRYITTTSIKTCVCSSFAKHYIFTYNQNLSSSRALVAARRMQRSSTASFHLRVDRSITTHAQSSLGRVGQGCMYVRYVCMYRLLLSNCAHDATVHTEL